MWFSIKLIIRKGTQIALIIKDPRIVHNRVLNLRVISVPVAIKNKADSTRSITVIKVIPHIVAPHISWMPL
jgi:hypothetical protein